MAKRTLINGTEEIENRVGHSTREMYRGVGKESGDVKGEYVAGIILVKRQR